MSVIFLLGMVGTAMALQDRPPPELGFLTETIRLPEARVEHLQIEGVISNGVPFRVSIGRDARRAGLNVSAELSGRRLGVVRLAADRVRDVDLSSAQVGYEPRFGLQLTIRHGGARQCYYNDDGRDRVRIIFKPGGRVELYDVSHENCGSIYRRLDN